MGVWLIVFWVRSAYLVNQHWFNAADGHPLLPPVIATWMAWLVALVDALSGEPEGVPGGWYAFTSMGGAPV